MNLGADAQIGLEKMILNFKTIKGAPPYSFDTKEVDRWKKRKIV
ncbi:hypothetical protein LX69_02844 [Breznakibacter xylanolyticus]|uniref:Uncharacterized protein n=1 Tax=Breznakibacter xylanolyticus TaxID=990 RepID=A0A2W7MX67_9BACT|nr:hypothetical protein LX69_02844 [Breznakibacter xylanolyticus]